MSSVNNFFKKPCLLFLYKKYRPKMVNDTVVRYYNKTINNKTFDDLLPCPVDSF